MLKIITTALLLSLGLSAANADGLYRDLKIKGLTYRAVGKAICYNTKISVNDEMVDASIQGQLQEVRGRDLHVLVNTIKAAENPPSVLVMDNVAFSSGEIVWTKNEGWFVCEGNRSL
ncbi:hypothetical protein [Agitococcus lubricus]|uniref:Uncharacterized protein n=1 Tax=Agitococcus lubricus TaxID=1077255 RepID=A0A2T5IVP3_9GAMM|nr:hypothetical protein [Agitococcus lubricus]PTQ87968.1 hypothetical protein C8N29_11553 [Agitococcus lubricus]